MSNQQPPTGDWFGMGEFSRDPSRWGPAVNGFMDGHGPVTFQPGVGPNAGHILLANGQIVSEADFNRFHNHYNGLGGGRDGGAYDGPGR